MKCFFYPISNNLTMMLECIISSILFVQKKTYDMFYIDHVSSNFIATISKQLSSYATRALNNLS